MSSGRTVLVIDDDPEVRDSLRTCLEIAGYVVHCAADGLSGIALAESCRPGLVVVDMLLPGQNGFLVLQRIKAGGPQAPPVMMITASEGGSHRAYAEVLGADDFLSKPFGLEPFLEKVRRWCP